MNRKKVFWIVGLVVISIGATFFWFIKSAKNSSIQYKEIVVEKGDLSVTILATGTVEPETRLNIQSPIAGRAEKVLADQGQQVKKGQILAWVSSTERAALLDGARSEGAEEIKKWEALYKPTPILAPVSGMIIQRNIQPGQTFSATDSILVMSDHLIVQAQVDETDIAQIHLKQKATIVLDAYPRESILATVEKIAYDAKTVNNVTTYEVDVLPDSTSSPSLSMLRSGMTANVTFPVGSKTGILILPSDSIKTKEGRPYVLIPSPRKGQPQQREITLGISDGKRVEISSGLSEGEIVLQQEYQVSAPKTTGSSPFAPKMRGGGRR